MEKLQRPTRSVSWCTGGTSSCRCGKSFVLLHQLAAAPLPSAAAAAGNQGNQAKLAQVDARQAYRITSADLAVDLTSAAFSHPHQTGPSSGRLVSFFIPVDATGRQVAECLQSANVRVFFLFSADSRRPARDRRLRPVPRCADDASRRPHGRDFDGGQAKWRPRRVRLKWSSFLFFVGFFGSAADCRSREEEAVAQFLDLFFLHSSADPPNKQSTRTRDKNKTIKKTFHASASRVPDQDRSIRFSGHLVVVFFFCSSTVGSNQQAAPSSVSSVGRASAEEKAFDDCFVDRLAEQFAFLATKRTRGAAGGSPSSDILFLSKEIFSQKKEKKKRKKMENLDAHPRAMKRTKV